jgi:hypothetical protein
MKSEDSQRVQIFLDKWKGSQGNERANYQGFFLELCDALAVDRPAPKGSITGDRYCFDQDIKIFNKDGLTLSGLKILSFTVNVITFYLFFISSSIS